MCLPQGGCRSSPLPPRSLPSLPSTPSNPPSPCEEVVARFAVDFFIFVRGGGAGGTYPSSANMGSRQTLVLRSVRFAVVLGALQLHLQPLHADLEAVHGLDGCLCRHGIVVADEACGENRVKIGVMVK